MSLVPSISQAVVGNYTIFYREAGHPSAPTVLLLHGFPSSSHQYRHLILILALFYHVIAPDLPGFGFTNSPSSFSHTFANIATVMGDFLDVVGVKKFAMYISTMELWSAGGIETGSRETRRCHRDFEPEWECVH